MRGHGGYLRVFLALNPRILLYRRDFIGAYCIFNKLCEIFGSVWIYEIYVDLLVRGINRVGRYFRSKYILTDVIEKRNAVKRSIN